MPEKTKSLEKMPGKTPEASSPSRTPTPSVSPSGFGLAAIHGAAGNMAMQRAAREEGGKDAPVRSESALNFLSVGRARQRDVVPVSMPGDRHEAEAREAAGQHAPAGATFCSRCATGAPCSSCGRPAVPREGLAPGGGAPLAPALRESAEARLGPIGDVRLHTGGDAARAASRLEARAYAYGSSIVFGHGAYAPHTGDGYQLLLHELAHTQRDPGGTMVHRQPEHGATPAPEPTVQEMIDDPSLFTDAMIDELLSEQDAADVLAQGEPDEATVSPIVFNAELGPPDGIPLASYDRQTHWEGTHPSMRQRWVAENLPRARFESVEERDYYREVAAGRDPTTAFTRPSLLDYFDMPAPAPVAPSSSGSRTCSSCHSASNDLSASTFEPLMPLDDFASPDDAMWAQIAAESATWEPTFRYTEPARMIERPTDEEIENGEGRLWRRGPRGERFRINGYNGPPRARYTKPMAIDAAARGDYEYAELAENYMCPSCHIPAAVGHQPSDAEFNLYAYTRSYERNYVMLFNMNPVSSAWNLGVTTGEVITGESSGLNLNEVMMGEGQMGRRLSGSERGWRAVEAGVGWATLGYGRFGGRPAPPGPRPNFGPPRVVYSGPGAAPPPRPMVAPRMGTSSPGSGPYMGPGGAAPALDVAPSVAPAAAAPARVPWLHEVPAGALAPPAPTPFPAGSLMPWVLPTTQLPRVGGSPSPFPFPAPQPAPNNPQNPGVCPRNTHMVVWPPPIWTTLGHGDSGATSGMYDFPPVPFLTRRRSPRRNRALVRQYTRSNVAALAAARTAGIRGAIHHKVPLFVSGPDTMDNFVFLPNTSHYAWHNLLARQGQTGWMIRDPYGTVYCVV
jgi:hypothetical protein